METDQAWSLHIPVKTGDTSRCRWRCPGGWPLGLLFQRLLLRNADRLALGQSILRDESRRHPTQIYESLFHLTMAGLLLLLTCATVCVSSE